MSWRLIEASDTEEDSSYAEVPCAALRCAMPPLPLQEMHERQASKHGALHSAAGRSTVSAVCAVGTLGSHRMMHTDVCSR